MFGVAFGLLIMLAAVASLPIVKNTWLRLSGAVIADLSSTHSYVDKPVRVLSTGGRRRVTGGELEDASAYHALVIFPRVVLKDVGSTSGNDGYTHTRVERWQVSGGQAGSYSTEERELKIVYDALWQTVTINSQVYHLREGNLFVIRFNERRHLEAAQLDAALTKEAGVEEVIGAFKSVLHGGEVVQQLQ